MKALQTTGNVAVGKLQGQGLLDCLSGKSGAQVIMLNGGTDIDNNAVLFKKGDPAEHLYFLAEGRVELRRVRRLRDVAAPGREDRAPHP